MVAVAIGSFVYFYKNMKPYFKYTFPGLTVDPLEKEIWKRVRDRIFSSFSKTHLTFELFFQLPLEKPSEIEESLDNLKSIKISELSPESQTLLFLPPEERQEFIAKNVDREIQRPATIVAMNKIRRTLANASVSSNLILASESGEIIILDPLSFSVLHHARTTSFSATPSLMSVSGQFDSDFYLVILTREGFVCMLRKHWIEGKMIFRVDHPAVGLSLLPIDQTIIVVCVDKMLECFSKKGKRLWGVTLPEPAMCMVSITLSHFGQTLVCVALSGGLVQIYSNKVVVDQFSVSGECQ